MALPPVNASAVQPAPPTSINEPAENRQVGQRERSPSEVQILQAQADASIRAGNEPLALVFRTAIEGINEALEPELGANAVQAAFDSGLDVSPEATAQRIVDGATGFFSSFQQQNPELGEEQQVDRFLEVIGSGVEQGFEEARDILDNLQVLEGDVATNIDQTFELVQQGLQDFGARAQQSAQA